MSVASEVNSQRTNSCGYSFARYWEFYRQLSEHGFSVIDFRCFLREAVALRGENLDISWLREESLHSGDGLPEPDEIAAEMEALTVLLEGDEVKNEITEDSDALFLGIQ